jgi:hypothetical protein
MCLRIGPREKNEDASFLSQSQVNERAHGPTVGGEETPRERRRLMPWEKINVTGGEETHATEWKTPVTLLIIFLIKARNS